MQSFKKHLAEKLNASDKMGDWVKDFQDSDAPQFKGKSKEKKRQMAVAAKLGAERDAGMREEAELDEGMSHPAADELNAYAVKHGGIDKKDFQVAAGKLNNFKATGSPKAVADLVRMLNNLDTDPMEKILVTIKKHDPSMAKSISKKMGIVIREEAELEEAAGYKATSEKSQFGGHRAHLKNPDGKTSYMGAAGYKKPEHAKGEAQAYHDAYFGGPGRANERGAERAVAAYRAKHKEHMHVKNESTAEYGKSMEKEKEKRLTPKDKDKLDKVRALLSKEKMKESVDLNESEINDLTAQYINENNITLEELENMTEAELNELIGKAIGGAFKLGAKAAVGAARIAGKAVNRVSTSGRADAAEKKAASMEKKNKDRDRIKAAQERLQKAKEAARNK